MSGAALDPFDFGSLRRGSFTYFPVAAGRVEFAAAVRECILTSRPRVVAVELPEQIERDLLRAVDRLPEISAIVYPDPLADDENIFVVVEPCDPFVEAIRSAREVQAEIIFIDPASGERPHLPDDYPDPYAIHYLGLDRYIEQYRLQPQPRNEELAAYAARVAWKLQGADPLAPTLVVLSLNLLDPVLDAMEAPQPQPDQRYRSLPSDLLNPHPDCLAEICTETPHQNLRYEQWRGNYVPQPKPVVNAITRDAGRWNDSPDPPGALAETADPFSGSVKSQVPGNDAVTSASSPPDADSQQPHLPPLSRSTGRHQPASEPEAAPNSSEDSTTNVSGSPDPLTLRPPDPHSSGSENNHPLHSGRNEPPAPAESGAASANFPWSAEHSPLSQTPDSHNPGHSSSNEPPAPAEGGAASASRTHLTSAPDLLIDRGRAQLALLKDAEPAYTASTGDKIVHWQRRLLARYSRNLAQVSGYLTASLFELTTAARGIVDDNYAWEVWTLANAYPPQKSETRGMETINLAASEIWLHTRKLKIRRRLPRPKQRLRSPKLKPRAKDDGDWARATDSNAICSYPPEDLAIEAYGRFLKTKAKSLLTDERDRVAPFTTSLLDGVDVRETIRNWSQRKIYVRETQRTGGEFGSLVVIFDSAQDDRYSYLTTWLGEHQNESDMAYYSTQPFEHLVGPGIGRAEYGGFLMTLPAGRLYDVWQDTDYEFAESKSERLLLAALDYAVERHVIYVAPHPPRSIFRSIAAQLNRKIVYIPIGQLNSEQLKKIRIVHVLDSHARRAEAKQFLW
jgi:hypothetical protein